MDPHAHSITGRVIVGSLFLLPPALIESWYKRRHRRPDERLFTLTADEPRLARIRTAVPAIRATPRTSEAGPKAGPEPFGDACQRHHPSDVREPSEARTQ